MTARDDETAVDRFVRWVRDEALPVWADRGYDAAAERFHERLDGDGDPLAVPHRAMVQARQIYVYAHAGALGWHPDGTGIAARAMATLRREFCVGGDGCAGVHFSIEPAAGQPHSMLRDAYTHAFVLFATAFLHRATGDPALLDFAGEIVRFLDERLADPIAGGVRSTADDLAGEKLQNPQMHLLEAYLALAEAAPGLGYLERARRLVALFRTRMLRRDLAILPERFDAHWGTHPDAAVADIFEPGHHHEWIWLLRWYERLAGDDLSDCRAMLRATAARGAAAGGLIHDQLGADGRIVRDTHRLWPHCEAIKAAMAGDEAVDEALAERSAAALLDHFLGRPFAGGWTDQLTPTLAPLVDYVPASSLYHLVLAAVVADEARASKRSAGTAAAIA